MSTSRTALSNAFLIKFNEWKETPHFDNSNLSERSFYVMGLFNGFLASAKSSHQVDDLSLVHSHVQDAIYSTDEFEFEVV